MSSQSSTSSLESLNESSTTKYGLLSLYMHELTISNKNNICYDQGGLKRKGDTTHFSL